MERLMWVDAMSNNVYNFSSVMFLKYLVIILLISFRTVFSIFARAQQYCTAITHFPVGNEEIETAKRDLEVFGKYFDGAPQINTQFEEFVGLFKHNWH